MYPTTDNQKSSSHGTEWWFRTGASVFVAILVAVVIWAGWDHVRPVLPETLVLYGFSTVEEAMQEGIFPAFQHRWHQQTGERVEFVATFAGSGAITGRILQRIPAEVAVLSSKLDARRLVGAGIAAQELPHEGVLTRTPFVILVREGNPKGIRDFADLARPGVSVVHSAPTTSGGAQWSILATYGAQWLATGDREMAFDRLLGIWKNVTVRLPDARAARREFESGTADALITYEQDVIPTPAGRRAVGEVVYPKSTIVSEQTVVTLRQNIDERQRDLVEAFVEFLWSEDAQRILVEHGFRSPQEELNQANPNLGVIESPFTLEDLGGAWSADQDILEGVWRARVLPELEGGMT